MRYALSDIHGCAKTFRKALKAIKLSKKDELFLLGDYVDRGPDSLGVLKHIWRLEADGYRVTCLRGNHEQMIVDHVRGRKRRYEWVPPRKFFGRTMDWLDDLPYYHETPGYFLVHAGLKFETGAPLEDLDAMLWIRNWYGDIDLDWLGDRIVVHGHTPATLGEVKQGINLMSSTQRVCIDSGCAWDKSGMGYLTVLNLDTQEGIFFERAKQKGLFSWS